MLQPVHPAFTLVGVAVSGLAATVLQATVVTQSNPWTIPLASAIFGAGSAWMAVKAASTAAMNKAKSAHSRLDEEKIDRTKAIDDLRAEVNLGMTRLEASFGRQLETQTKTILAAVRRSND